MEAESLAATCALAFAVAREGVEAVPPVEPPAPMRTFLYLTHLPKRAMSVAQRVLEDDEAFRRRVIERASVETVGAEGYRWLTEQAGAETEESAFSRLADRAEISLPEQEAEAPAAPPMPEPPAGASPLGPPGTPIPPMPTPPGGVVGDPFGGAAVPPRPTPPAPEPVAAVEPTPVTESPVTESPAPSTTGEAAATSGAIEDELANLRSLVDRLADERTAVTSSVDDLETEVAERRSESSALSSEIQSLRGDLDAAKAAESAQNEQVADAQRRADEVQGLLGATEERASQAESDRDALRRTVARLDAERLEIESRLQESEQALSEARAAAESNAQELGETRTRLAETAAALDEQRSSAETAQSANAARVAELEASLASITAAGGELERTREALGVADAELASVRSELETSRADLDASRAEVASLKSQLDASQAEAELIRVEAAEAKAAAEAVRTDLEAERAAVAEVRGELEATERTLAASARKVTELEGQLSETNDKLTTAEGIAAQVTFLREELGNAQNEREELITKLEVSEQARTDVEHQLTTVSSQWRDLQMELVKLGEHRAAVESELQELLAERQSTMAERAKLFGDLGAQLGRVEAERDLLAAQLVRAREHLDGTRAAFAEATEAITTKLDDTGSRMGEVDADLAEADGSIERLSTAVGEAAAVVAEPVEVPTLESAVTDHTGEIVAPVDPEPAVEPEATVEPEAFAEIEVVDPEPFEVDEPEFATTETLSDETADEAAAADGTPAEVANTDDAAPLAAEDASGWASFDNDPGFAAETSVGRAAADVEPAAWMPEQLETDGLVADEPTELAADDLDEALSLQGLGADAADADEIVLPADDEPIAVEPTAETQVEGPDRRRIDVPSDLANDRLATTRYVVATEDVVLLVDGDAVAGMGWPSMATPARRDLLVDRLTGLAAETGAAPDLVFDGSIGDDGELPVSKSVRVRLTASGVEPATALAALVDTYPRHWPVAIVTDNPIVAGDAQARGASVLSSSDLLDLFLVK